MYDFAEIRTANDALWQDLAKAFTRLVIKDLPARLERPGDLMPLWNNPDLLFAQTCGYPMMSAFFDRVTVLATPVYATRFFQGPDYGSVIIVPGASPITTLEEARGSVCAINQPDSNTGMNLLRHALARNGAKAPFFKRVMVTGAHRKSLAAVADGEAGIAAIDAVSFAHFEALDRDAVSRIRILGKTATSPGLPFITARSTNAETVAKLREGLFAVVRQKQRPAYLDTLRLVDCVEPHDYAPVLGYEKEAAGLGYPLLA
jgi:ABC-type phosphate/phosphonate transport system substrate-binding protein